MPFLRERRSGRTPTRVRIERTGDDATKRRTRYDILRILSFPRTQSIGSDHSSCDVCRLLEAYFVRSRKNVLQADLYPIIQIRSVFCRLDRKLPPGGTVLRFYSPSIFFPSERRLLEDSKPATTVRTKPHACRNIKRFEPAAPQGSR